MAGRPMNMKPCRACKYLVRGSLCRHPESVTTAAKEWGREWERDWLSGKIVFEPSLLAISQTRENEELCGREGKLWERSFWRRYLSD